MTANSAHVDMSEVAQLLVIMFQNPRPVVALLSADDANILVLFYDIPPFYNLQEN